MRIAVTGGTGYLGAPTVARLLADGHEIALLVHPAESLQRWWPDFAAHRERITVVRGDVCDSATITALLDGCSAVLHAAGIVATDDKREALMWQVNVDATAEILARAALAGLDPIVHVASYSALFPCPDPVMTPDSPTAPGRSAYGRTKSAADRMARALQRAGAPVVITYPSSVIGPGLAGTRGITERGWNTMLRTGFAPRLDGGMAMIDVRDVAEVHAAVMRPGRGPRRYLCGGHQVGFDRAIDLLADASGTRIRRIPVRPSVFRGMGRAADAAGRWFDIDAAFGYEAAWLLTAATPTDDSATLADFGLTWRPTADSVRAMFAAPAGQG
ncbi:NAD-dependent epimerase/dehydratase family protein [Nocardia thailandica]|uniref:NAD-dependent epimerase/dehydratase family protein n=1 Tax=Nocardia thailandica TaxID=257275 RepID=UPI00030ACA24|nr:NAD-dependent epimerase/dehydratase family protein [Nocardia thailandica]